LLANDTAGPANEAGQTLTVTAVTAGPDTHGTVTLAGGTVTYTAAPGFAGVATYTYRVCDNGTTAGRPDPLCADGVVSVTVAPTANQPPVADQQTVQAVEDTLPITLTGSDLTTTRVRVVTGPSHDAVGHCSAHVHPAPDYFGPGGSTFAVSDGRATSTPAKVSITVSEVNDPPIPSADSQWDNRTDRHAHRGALWPTTSRAGQRADQLLDIESVTVAPAPTAPSP
jgi:hypothetical protein